MNSVSKTFKTLRGNTKFKSKNKKHTIKEITLKNLFDCCTNNIIILPEFQRLLDVDKVNNMVVRYKKDAESFRFLTNYIQLICMDDNKYLILDGQHRINMYKILLEQNYIDGEHTTILVNIINETNEDEIYELYKNLNYDISDKLKPKINQNIEVDNSIKKLIRTIKYSQLKELLSQHSKKFLSNSKFIYTLDEFIDILYNNYYIEAFPTSTASEAYDYLMKANAVYYKCFYSDDVIKNIKFTKDEEANLKKSIILNFKQNNFINVLTDCDILNDNFTAFHTWIDNNVKHNLKKLVIQYK